MPFVFVNKAEASGNAVTSLTISVPSAVQEGDIMIALIGTENQQRSSIPSGWTELHGEKTVTSGSAYYVSTMYRVVTSGEASSYAFNADGSTDMLGCILAYTNHSNDSSSPVDVKGDTTQTSGTAHPAPSVTVTEADALLICLWYLAATAGPGTAPTGMTERVDTTDATNTIYAADQQLNVIGATQIRKFTTSASGASIGLTVVIRKEYSPAPGAIENPYVGGIKLVKD